jgi:hypothetical protein
MKVSTTSPTLRTPRRPRGCCCTGSTPRSSSSTQPTSAIASWSWLLPKPDLKQVVIDGSTINTIDSTGADTLDALARDLSRQGVRLGLAGFGTETKDLLERTGVTATIGTDSVYETLKEAMTAFQADHSPPRVEPATETWNDRNITSFCRVLFVIDMFLSFLLERLVCLPASAPALLLTPDNGLSKPQQENTSRGPSRSAVALVPATLLRLPSGPVGR